MRTRPLLVLLALSLSATQGCTEPLGAHCDVDTDCDAALVCNMYSSVCSPPALVCESDKDCDDPGLPSCSPLHECSAAAAALGDTSSADVFVATDITLPDVSDDMAAPVCPALPETALRATLFAIGTDGEPGSGLDVDDDPVTCAPADNCSGGVDNAMVPLGELANGTFVQAIEGGELNLFFLTEPPAPEGEGPGAIFSLLTPAGSADGAGAFRVEGSHDSPPCPVGGVYRDAFIDGGVLRAGFATPTTVPLTLIVVGMRIEATLHDARIQATVTRGGDSALDSFDGLLAGWIVQQELLDAVDAIPDEDIPAYLNKQGIKDILDSLPIEDDIDTDGDGAPDARSIGIHIVAEPVSIDGWVGGE